MSHVHACCRGPSGWECFEGGQRGPGCCGCGSGGRGGQEKEANRPIGAWAQGFRHAPLESGLAPPQGESMFLAQLFMRYNLAAGATQSAERFAR